MSMIEKLPEDKRGLFPRFLANVPVNIYALCEAAGVDVYVRKDMPEGLSGFIWKKEDDKCHIFCNGNEPATRQRFTVAHELAHFLLHKEKLKDEYPENVLLRGGLSNKEEIEANKFAAEVLMPYPKIDEYVHNNPDFTIAELARHFEVSSQAMSIRLGIPLDI